MNVEYKTGKDYTATVISDIKVPGNTVNKAWSKPMRLITVMFSNNRMATYLSNESIEVSAGQVITTHNSINKDGYVFISLRDIK